MEAWAIQAFVDAHPQWKHMQGRLTTKQRGGWEYVRLDGLEIGRVKIDGRSIFAELLMGYTKLGE